MPIVTEIATQIADKGIVTTIVWSLLISSFQSSRPSISYYLPYIQLGGELADI